MGWEGFWGRGGTSGETSSPSLIEELAGEGCFCFLGLDSGGISDVGLVAGGLPTCKSPGTGLPKMSKFSVFLKILAE